MSQSKLPISHNISEKFHNLINVSKNSTTTLEIEKFPCLMERKGIKVEKRKSCDDLFVETFRKKLKIENSVELKKEIAQIDPVELKEIAQVDPVKWPQCTALILYKEPIQDLPTELLTRLKNHQIPMIENVILSREHFKIENILEINEEEISDNEMELD